jgi:hypothetical protein
VVGMKYEYAAFRVEVPVSPTTAENPYIPVNDWPDMTGQTALLEKMNQLGSEGWDIFERKLYPPEAAPRTIRVYNLWARRIVA